MKIVYCICSLYNPGGMERVLLNKVSYLASKRCDDITIVTTDQQGLPPFYPFPEAVRMVDLGINYSLDNERNVFWKVFAYLRKRRKHRKALSAFLREERADIVVSLYPSESSFIPSIKDGSKKVLELHYCKFFRLQYGRGGLLGLIDKWRTKTDERLVRRFDSFVVLTNEDKTYWGDLPNMTVIPNAALPAGGKKADMSARRVIAVGRLDYQKGFDRLIRAWQLVRKSGKFADWRLDIFGQGAWKEKLQRMIDRAGLHDCAALHAPTSRIGDEYAASSLLAMSSHYEGFPMVMVEAMACGLPVVSFDFKCGPKDIIEQGVNGLLVKNDDVEGLSRALMDLMGDEDYRRQLSAQAQCVTEIYSEEAVMGKWTALFDSLVRS